MKLTKKDPAKLQRGRCRKANSSQPNLKVEKNDHFCSILNYCEKLGNLSFASDKLCKKLQNPFPSVNSCEKLTKPVISWELEPAVSFSSNFLSASWSLFIISRISIPSISIFPLRSKFEKLAFPPNHTVSGLIFGLGLTFLDLFPLPFPLRFLFRFSCRDEMMHLLVVQTKNFIWVWMVVWISSSKKILPSWTERFQSRLASKVNHSTHFGSSGLKERRMMSPTLWKRTTCAFIKSH